MGRTGYRPRNLRWFNRILRWTFGRWLRRTYGLEGEGLGIFREIKPPFVLVCNHVTTRDPFFVSTLVPEPVWWVSSDAYLRSAPLRFLLSLVGAIPKAKAIPDLVTVDAIVKTVRKRKGVIGIFPEGEQSWDGRTQRLGKAGAKLFKLLKVPVIVARIQGGYAALPRWTWKRRGGGVRVTFEKVLGPEELATMDFDAIEATLVSALHHDDLAWIESEGRNYRSRRRAERLELALFMCPTCSGLGTMRSEGATLRCESCGAAQLLDGRYRFRRLGATEPRFGDPREWMEWQAAAVSMLAFEAVAGRREGPLFSDEDVRVLRGRHMRPLSAVARGRLELHRDRMELVEADGTHLVFHLRDIDGIGILTRQTLEFHVGRHLYRATFAHRGVSALKWRLAVEALKREAQ